MRHLRHPVLWMLLALAVSFLHRESKGGLTPVRQPDTASYERVARLDGLEVTFGHVRTPGYPLVLRLAGEHRLALKRCEYATYLLAVLALWWALRMWFRSGWIALAGALPLLFADVLAYTGWLQPDVLAAAFALFTVASLILVVTGWRPRWSWSALALAVLAACLLRPVYVFLLPLVFVAGMLMHWLHSGSGRGPRFALRLAAAGSAPVLAFCLLRWLIVGQFGLVAFLGYNLSGVAASFLNPPFVSKLPAEERALAEPILAWREARGWRPYEGQLQVTRWHDEFTPNIYRAVVPAVRRTLARGPAHAQTQWLAIDERLREWSLTVLRRQPERYRRWVRGNLVSGITSLSRRATITFPLALLALSVPFAIARRGSPGRDPAASRALIGLAVLAVGYFLCKLLLLAIVSVPLDRYVDAAVLLLPVLIWTEIAVLWRASLWPAAPTAS